MPLWPHPCGVAMIPGLGSCTRPDAACPQANSLGGLLHQLFEGLAHDVFCGLEGKYFAFIFLQNQ